MTGRLDPPGHYNQDRRDLWADTITRLRTIGRVFQADPHVLDTYIEAITAHRQASELVSRTNVLVTRGDRAIENPALQVQRRTAADVARASKALGLDRTPMTEVLAESPMRGDGARWCDEHNRAECKHHRTDGDWCHQHSLIAGLGACKHHAGLGLDQAREQGRVNLARLYQSEPLDVDPAGVLLFEMRASAAHVQDLREQVAALAHQPGPDGVAGSGLWWALVSQTERDGITERVLKAGPNVVLRAYELEREHLVRAAAAAHTAGAQAEQVDVAKAVGGSITRLLDAAFEVLELTEHQRRLIPVRMPDVLRTWDPAAGAQG